MMTNPRYCPPKRTIIIIVLIVMITIGWTGTKKSGSFPSASDRIEDNEVVRPMAMPDDQTTTNHHHLGPYFVRNASKNLTVLVGHTAYLNCRVKNIGNRTVTWIRHRDLHLLTVGRVTYTADQRFTALHNPLTDDWTLQVRYPQRRDSGIYECQVGMTPPIGLSLVLIVVEPITNLIGGPEIFINKGSTMNLTCIVHHSPEPPASIYWTHNSQGISYDSPRGGVSVITEKGEMTISHLLVQRASESDSGQYTCNPSNANPKTVIVHVLNGEYPAAMQHGGQLRLEYPLMACVLSVLLAFGLA